MPLLVLTDTDTVLTRLAAVLRMDPGHLVNDAPQWADITRAAVDAGTGLVQRALEAKNYTPDQIAADPQIKDLATQAALVQCLTEASLGGTIPADAVKVFRETFERRLGSYPLIAADNTMAPAGGVGVGMLDAVQDASGCGSVFTRPTPRGIF